MRRVIVSSFVLVLCLGFNEDVNAKKKTVRAVKRATSSSTVRARGSVSTTSTTSSSSSTDISTSMHRFIADSMNYDTKLMYGVKYDLADMLLPSVSSYYLANGSEAINEKLCFGPYMQLTGISTSGDIVSYTAEGGFECQPLQAGYSYQLELKEATNEKLKTFAFPRRLRVVRLSTETQTDVDVNYMQFEYEPFVDVSEFVPKIVNAIAEAKSSCSAVSADMEKLRSNLGWSTGLSAAGLALSGGATGVGVYNVVKTNQMDGQLKQHKNLTVEKGKVNKDTVETYTDDECEKEKRDTLYCRMKSAEKELKKYDSKSADKGAIEKKIDNSLQAKNLNEFVEFIDGVEIEDGQFKKCKSTVTNNVECLQIAAKFQGLDYSSQTAFDNTKESVKNTLRDAYVSEQNRIIAEATSKPTDYLKSDEQEKYNEAKKAYEDAKLAYDRQVQTNNTFTQKETLEKNVTSSLKTTRILDWVQAGLNAGSLLTSGGSLALSASAISVTKSALEHLNDCENKVSALNLLYNQYNAEIKSYGEE